MNKNTPVKLSIAYSARTPHLCLSQQEDHRHFQVKLPIMRTSLAAPEASWLLPSWSTQWKADHLDYVDKIKAHLPPTFHLVIDPYNSTTCPTCQQWLPASPQQLKECCKTVEIAPSNGSYLRFQTADFIVVLMIPLYMLM